MPFFRFKNVEQAKKTHRENARCIALIQSRITKEGNDAKALYNLVELCADYLIMRENGEDKEREKALKRVNRWVKSYESDARALANYKRMVALSAGYLVDNGVSMREVTDNFVEGFDDGIAEAKKRGYVNG